MSTATAQQISPTISASSELRLITLVIPIYNEEDHLLSFLEHIDKLALPLEKELVFIDDGSSDKSLKIIKEFNFTSTTKILAQPHNCGKGAAIRRGIAEASGDVIGVQDADFEYDPREIPAIIEPLIAGRSDIAFGSRFKNPSQAHRTYHYLVNRFLTLASNFLSGLYLTDMETCYKFFRREVIQNIALESDRFGFEPEVTAKIAKLKVRVSEVPISYFPRNYLEGKKITWKDGFAALWHLIRFNLFTDLEGSIKKDLPQKFLPKGGHWL